MYLKFTFMGCICMIDRDYCQKCSFNGCYIIGPTGQQGATGPTGATGPLPLFEIGSVTTGEPDSLASVSITPISKYSNTDKK